MKLLGNIKNSREIKRRSDVLEHQEHFMKLQIATPLQ